MAFLSHHCISVNAESDKRIIQAKSPFLEDSSALQLTVVFSTIFSAVGVTVMCTESSTKPRNVSELYKERFMRAYMET